jgi:hypothetical protein
VAGRGRADAVITWNENAANAATAACIHISGNGLGGQVSLRFWRPITAIRLGDTDGNSETDGVADWTPLQWTYPMPDHDCGHAVQGGVAAEVLKQMFSTDHVLIADFAVHQFMKPVR